MIDQIATQLVEFCRKGEFEAAQNALYSEKAISVEPQGSPNPVVQGLNAIKEKGREFEAMIEAYHGITVSDPILSQNYFAVIMNLDVTMKGIGRAPMEEVCVYGVEGDKIVSEHFFYSVTQPA